VELPGAPWAECLAALKTRDIRVWGTLHYAQAVGLTGDGTLLLRPSTRNPLETQELRNPDTLRLLTECAVAAGVGVRRVALEPEGGERPSGPAAGNAVLDRAAVSRQASGTPGDDAGTSGGAGPGRGEPLAATEPASGDRRSMGEIFRDEPMIQRVLDMFEGEVLP
jgi:hypothetical protein